MVSCNFWGGYRWSFGDWLPGLCEYRYRWCLNPGLWWIRKSIGTILQTYRIDLWTTLLVSGGAGLRFFLGNHLKYIGCWSEMRRILLISSPSPPQKKTAALFFKMPNPFKLTLRFFPSPPTLSPIYPKVSSVSSVGEGTRTSIFHVSGRRPSLRTVAATLRDGELRIYHHWIRSTAFGWRITYCEICHLS